VSIPWDDLPTALLALPAVRQQEAAFGAGAAAPVAPLADAT
jgi:hypothetical protein